ncbi:hypothetical protein N0V84_011964 [Fusarium piperis]|uniref:C2H2-type domain-containing protein n=1 Tax=Fusarium piperis TaxID=1435070 RepID=A0A9W8TCV8_9HYPO|nr:hypothetical protein N0V84_011964 [Fusarium piperis]
MGICAVQSKPHVATFPRPSLIRMNLSSVIGKSKDHQQIPPVGLEQIEWRDEVPFSITFGNVATKPTNKAFVPSYAETIVLDENDYKLCYNVVAFSFVAVQLFEFMSAACRSQPFEDPKPSADSPCQNGGADVDVDKQVSSCAGYDPHVCGQKRQSSGGGGGGSEPKKHRSNKQGDGNYNNAPPGDNGAVGGSGSGHGHGDNGGGSGENDDTQNSGNAPREKRLACPFHKLDPELFRDCESIKLTSWDRVLQHIFRAHVLQKHYCPKCRTQFRGQKAEREKNEHIRNECQPAGMMETGYIFLEIEPDDLCFETDYENLKGLPRGTDEYKWFEAWKKLFPGVPLPKSALFESMVDVLRRNARRVLAQIPEPHRSRFYNAIFDIPTVASQRPLLGSTPPAPIPARASNSAAMALNPNMTPLAPASSPAPITAPTPATAPLSRRPHQVPPSMSTNSAAGHATNAPSMRRRPAQAARMSPPYGSNPNAGQAINMPTQVQTNPQVGHGQPSSSRAMNAPARPHPPSPSVGYNLPLDPNLTAGWTIGTPALPILPDEVLMDTSSFELYPQNPLSQLDVLGQLNHLDPALQAWSSPPPMFDDSMWHSGTENIFANPEMGTAPGVGESEEEDDLNRPSGFGNSSGYQDPGSGSMG